MRFRSSTLLVLCALACANSGSAAKAPLGVYYSFDAPAPAALLDEMQSELTRILAPSGLSADWRASDEPRRHGEDFPGLVVFRFSGHCTVDDFEGDAPNPAGQALAETDIINGHVLPFAKVDCDRVRALIAPTLKRMPRDWQTETLGRALARVGAHEIYHMLTGVEEHASRGIFQAGHSRRDLTATTFSFAGTENNWLHSWLEKQRPREQVVQVLPVESESAAGEAPEAESAAGR